MHPHVASIILKARVATICSWNLPSAVCSQALRGFWKQEAVRLLNSGFRRQHTALSASTTHQSFLHSLATNINNVNVNPVSKHSVLYDGFDAVLEVTAVTIESCWLQRQKTCFSSDKLNAPIVQAGLTFQVESDCRKAQIILIPRLNPCSGHSAHAVRPNQSADHFAARRAQAHDIWPSTAAADFTRGAGSQGMGASSLEPASQLQTAPMPKPLCTLEGTLDTQDLIHESLETPQKANKCNHDGDDDEGVLR